MTFLSSHLKNGSGCLRGLLNDMVLSIKIMFLEWLVSKSETHSNSILIYQLPDNEEISSYLKAHILGE